MRGNYQVRFCGGRGAAMLFSPTQHRITQQIEVYRRDHAQLVLVATLLAEDTLTSPLLPEFNCAVAQIFGSQV